MAGNKIKAERSAGKSKESDRETDIGSVRDRDRKRE